MKHLILFHGMGATSKDQWLPYVKNHYENDGWKVDALDIPESGDPDLKRWVSYVDQHIELTSETILVGHSAGCPLILTLLERSGLKIKKAILVAGFVEDVGYGVMPVLQSQYSWEKIKQNCQQFYFVNSDNDPYHCDDKQGRIMMDNLGGTQIIMSGEGHFGTSEFNQPYPQFPFLVKLISD